MSVKESQGLIGQQVKMDMMASPQYWHESEESTSLVLILLRLKHRWKQILLITAIGLVLTLAAILLIDKIYRAQVQVSLPQVADVSKIAENGLIPVEPKDMMKLFYNKVRSEAFFRQYLIEKGYLQQLYPDDNVTTSEGKLFSRIARQFKVTIDEPVLEKDAFVDSPTRFTLSIEHMDEALIVKLLNEYLVYANDRLTTQLTSDQTTERNTQLTLLERELASLRNDEKTRRELKIAKLEAENNLQLSLLEQRKALLIGKAKDNRDTEIATIIEKNQQTLDQLEQRKTLLVAKAADDRKVRIAQTKEAFEMAKNLGIEYPTQLDELGSNTSKDGKTNIILSNNQSLPNYLMGTKYLSTLIESLEKREDDAAYLAELNNINNEIALVKDDIRLKVLQARPSDAPYLAELNDINSEINRIKNDLVLAELKSRSSDDPYIDALPGVLQKINALQQLSMDFVGSQSYTLDKAAIVTTKAVKPNRLLLLIVGLMLSVFIALAIALFNNAVEELARRKKLQPDAEFE